MSYLNCVVCGVSIRGRPRGREWPSCPQCRIQTGLAIPLYRSDRQSEPDLPAATLAGRVEMHGKSIGHG